MLNINEKILILSNCLPFLFDILMAAYFGVTPTFSPRREQGCDLHLNFCGRHLVGYLRCNVFIMFIISKHVVNVILGPRGDGEEKYLETNIIIREIAKQGT